MSDRWGWVVVAPCQTHTLVQVHKMHSHYHVGLKAREPNEYSNHYKFILHHSLNYVLYDK